MINKLVKIQDNVGTIIKENKNPLPMGAVRKTLDNVCRKKPFTKTLLCPVFTL